MRQLFTPLFAFLLLSLNAAAQKTPNFWTTYAPETAVVQENRGTLEMPLHYQSFQLDFEGMAAYLSRAPREFTLAARRNDFNISIPNAQGNLETFAVSQTRVMAASLEAQLPEIGTYSGVSLETPGKSVRITVTPGWGFQAMILLADKGVEYLEPLFAGQKQYYMVYNRLDLPYDARMEQLPKCTPKQTSLGAAMEAFTPRVSAGIPEPGSGERLLGEPVSLKIYRFACATTGDFSQDVGGTKDLVFQKLTALTNQLNGIFERDVALRLELIAQSYDVIFLDPATDPYSGSTVHDWLDQNLTVMGNFGITPDLYDIGHVFAKYFTGGAIGVAYLNSCCSESKAGGCSAWYGPTYGDPFIGIAAHEIGHQLSAGHTFNQCEDDSQYAYESACEPGSGNSIMSYHGACGNNNVEGTKYLFYHACTMAQINQFVQVDGGATCGEWVSTANTAPEVSTQYPALLTIPVNTPFELQGQAVDVDGDEMVYTWEEIDLGPSRPLGEPSGNSPLFRYYPPAASTARAFPRIQTVVSNTTLRAEVLPSYNRDLKFVFVARDNMNGVAWDTVTMRSTTSAGPFLVTYPNEANLSLKAGSYHTITWDVANTHKAPVNAPLVNIKLVRVNTSPSNTITELETLAENVPNIGFRCVLIPDLSGSDFRIRIEGANHVFYDLSNNNFSIEPPVNPAFSLCAAYPQEIVCLPEVFTHEISTAAVAGFSEAVTLSAIGLPNGGVATFEPNPVQAGANSTMTISFPGGSPQTTFSFQVRGTADTLSSEVSLGLTVIGNDFTGFAPQSPLNGASGVNPQPTLFWQGVPDADRYEVQLATNPSFSPEVLVATKVNITVDSFQSPLALEEGQVYYWRVRLSNECSQTPWSEPQAFATAIRTCTTREANDLPKTISANGTPTIESKITFNANTVISDLNVTSIQGNHQFFKDLEVRLISPAGTNVLLWKDKCGGYNGNFNIGMDDGPPNFLVCPPPNNGTAYKPASPLSAFNGQSSAGEWTLRVKDNTITAGGSLQGFAIEICTNTSLNPPALLVNNPLTLPAGSNAAIVESLLMAVDADQTPEQLVFTLMSLPAKGLLLINSVSAQVGSQFTQADINNGGVRYYDYGLNQGQDDFDFTLTDGSGGLILAKFVVQPSVGIQSPGVAGPGFELAPNPTVASAVLTLTQAMETDSRILLLNVAGQTLRQWPLPAGASGLRLELQQVPPGVYMVVLDNDYARTVKKLVVR